MNSFGARLSSFGGSRNIPLNVRAAAADSGVSPYEIVSLDFANQQYWRQGVRSSFGAIPGITFGANAPNLTADGLLIENADDAVTLTDLDALGLTSAVLAAGYTVVASYVQPPSSVGSGLVVHLYNGTAERAGLQNVSGTTPRWFQVSGGVSEGNAQGAPRTEGAVVQHALRVAPNNFRAAYDGVLTTADTSISSPSVANLALGFRGDLNLEFFGGLIRDVIIIPRAVSDAELQALSAL